MQQAHALLAGRSRRRTSMPPPSSGSTSSSKYVCSAAPRNLPASSIGMPEARATSIAVTGPLSADMRPSQNRYSPPLLGAARVVVERDRIGNRRRPGQIARGRAVALGQRHERGAGRDLADAPVERARLARERAVDRVHERRRGEVRERQPERAGVVADDVERVSIVHAGECVQELRLREPQVVAARLREGGDEAGLGVASRRRRRA